MLAATMWAQTGGFITDRAVATNPNNGDLHPIAFGPVRVCTQADIGTNTSPCPHAASITDIFGNPLSIVGGNFGQLQTDVVGRFSFGCTSGNYLIQVAAAATNTPQLNYPISCPIGGGGGGGGGTLTPPLAVNTVACAALRPTTVFDDDCPYIFNSLILKSAGSLANNNTHTLNVYLETDMHQTAIPKFSPLMSTLNVLVDSGTTPQSGSNGLGIGIESIITINDLSLSGVTSPNTYGNLTRTVVGPNVIASTVGSYRAQLPDFQSGSNTQIYYAYSLNPQSYAGTVQNSAAFFTGGSNQGGIPQYGLVAAGAIQAIIADDLFPTTSGICHGSYGPDLPLSALHDCWFSGTGAPQGVITANIGSIYSRQNGTPGNTLYVKTSGNGTNTGWDPVASGIPGVIIDAQTGTSYIIPTADNVHFVTGTNAVPTAWTGPALAANIVFSFENLGAGLITYTPASGTVNGAATQIIPSKWFGFEYTDNANTLMPVMPTIAAFPNCVDTGGQHLNFTASTGILSCGTTGGGGGGTLTGGGAINQVAYWTSAVNLTGNASLQFVISGSTATLTLGASSATNGNLVFDNSTNANAITIVPTTGAGTLTLPSATGTFAVSASTPIVEDAAGNLTCSSCVVNNGVNTATAAMTLDLSASTVANAFKVPVGAGLTAGVNGVIAYDSTAGSTVIRTNGATSFALGIGAAFSAISTIPSASNTTNGLMGPTCITATTTGFVNISSGCASGLVVAAGSIQAPQGTISAAAYIFAGDIAGAGIYRPAAATYAGTNGTNEQWRLSANGLKMISGGAVGMTASTTSSTGAFDTCMSRAAAGVAIFDTDSACSNGQGKVKAAAFMSVGTTFTSNAGCTESTLVGGATAGSFKVGQSTACTIVITMGNTATAPNGWTCSAYDETNVPSVAIRQTAHTTTSCSLLMTVATNDIIVFDAEGW